jgi:hypothetical protein
MKNKQLNRNLYIIITTLIIFAIGYYLYIEVYTKNKEEHIITTKSRILEQMSHNLQVKVKSMGINASEYIGYILELSKDKRSPEDNFASMLKLRKDIQYYNPNLDYASSGLSDKGDVPADSIINVNPEAMSDFLYFRLVLGEKYKKYTKNKIQFKTRYDVLMSDFMQRNVFNDYILIVDDNIIYSTLSGKPNLTFNELSGQAKSEESITGKVNSSESVDLANQSKKGQATIRGVTTHNLSISNIEYKLFVCQMQVDKKIWYMCGLVKTELLDQSKKGMAPWVVILIFMVLSLIILGLPFIKLKVMSATEQITSGTLINSAVSLFFGTSFIMLFIFFVSNAFWYRNQNEIRLKNLAKEINDSLINEIKNSWHQLDFYDEISYKRSNVGKSLTDSADILKKSLLNPVIYPYFDYAFWMDTTGMQKGLLTPFPKVDKPSNLFTRDYFKKPDEWNFPGSDSCRFRMESIVSVTSGIVKVALSKPSRIDNMVIAMTGRFYSIIEPLIAEDYKFCIIDKKGLVWFHSDKLRNLQENFITECSDDKSLTAVIYANASRTLDVDYYDESYRIHVSPLTPMPLYLVTMFDKQAEHAYQVQELMLTLLLLSSLVLLILMEVLALYVLIPFSSKSGWKNLIVDFIGMKENQHKIYIVLSISFVLISILYLMLTNPVNILNPLLFALVMVLFLFPFLNNAINGFALKSSGRKLFAILNFILIVLVNISSVRFLSDYDFNKLLLFQIAVISVLVACFYVLRSGITLKFSNCNTSFYVCFLMGLLLIFSIVPSIKFFEASVNHEMIRGMKHNQLILSRQRESRNIQLRNYYKLMEQNHKLNPSVEAVYKQRLEQGIYSKFAGSAFYSQGKTLWKELDENSKRFVRNNKAADNSTGENFINLFRPIYDRTSIETKYLEKDSLMNGYQVWSIYEKSLVFDYLSTSEKYEKLKSDSCRICTDLELPAIFAPLSTLNSLNGWSLSPRFDIIFILLLLSVFYSIYVLIQFGTKKILGIPITKMYTEYNFENSVNDRLNAGNSVMVIGSHFVNLAEHVTEKLKVGFDLTFLDFAKQENVITSDQPKSAKDVQIIENFAFDYYSQSVLSQQINAINEKIRKKERIVIICTIAPCEIQEYLGLKAKLKADVKEKDKVDTVSETWEHLLLSFNKILSNAYVLYSPERYDHHTPKLSCFSLSKCKSILDDYSGDYGENLRCLVCRELMASTYLSRYSGEMMKFYDELVRNAVPAHIIKDRIIARIVDLSQLYYDSIFDLCTPNEQFVLSDMAEDMIVNSKNKSVVMQLINRGLFVLNGCSIRFMNESFRKYIITKFTPEEKVRLKERLGDSGTSWQGYKLFLILIMIGLVSFLFISNKAILDNLNKLFLVIGGGTVLFTNLTGLLSRKEGGNTR